MKSQPRVLKIEHQDRKISNMSFKILKKLRLLIIFKQRLKVNQNSRSFRIIKPIKEMKLSQEISLMQSLWTETTSMARSTIRLLKEESSSSSSSWIETTSIRVNISWATTGNSKGTSTFPSSNTWEVLILLISSIFNFCRTFHPFPTSEYKLILTI